MAQTLKERIISTLIESKNIKRTDIDAAIALARDRAIGLDKALLEKGLISEKELLVLLVKELHVPFINLNKYKISPELKEIIPEKVARQYKIVPISKLQTTITVALADPLNIFAIDDLKNITGSDIDVVMGTESDILRAIDTYYGVKEISSVQEVSKDIDIKDFEVVSDQSGFTQEDINIDEGEQAPIIRMVNLIIKEGLKQRASDIHIEPQADRMRVRYRIDGILQEAMNIPKQSQNAIIIRIKIMSKLDITTTRIPQDGRFKMKVGTQEVDFRVSLLPTTFGQKVVMRVLDRKSLNVGLDGLGFSKEATEKLKEAIHKPFGMILVTGPTGSGKSTTLYSILNSLNTVDRNIITVEDPVEYLIEGMTQIQAHAEIGLTFASGLRSILRQSPDIVMVGEIRDSETADIAIKASLTGQLVFSTLHTNDASGALTRIIDMGVEPFLVSSSLVMVIAQRLCRKMCQHCKEEIDIPESAFKNFKTKVPAKTKFYHGKGCNLCRKTGYSGRMGVSEILEIDDVVRDMIIRGASSDEIKKYAVDKQGMLTLWEDAMRKFIAGMTTYEEVMRITSDE